MKNGIDNIKKYDSLIIGKNLGLITNQSGVLLDGRSSIDYINENYKLIRLYAPEHGVRGNIEAGEKVNDEIDEKSGIYVQSLYNNEINLDGIDILLYDIQDVGLRFYTYIYVLANAMKTVAKANKKMLVLDRANPLGLSIVRGTVIEDAFNSGVGGFALPTRYGLTVGEFARYINKEYNINCDLTIVKCENLIRKYDFSNFNTKWIKPSPNLPSFNSLLCYEGSCIFEGTNISEGRGTNNPFETIGAPFINSKELIDKIGEIKGAKLLPISFMPTFSKYKGEQCFGVHIEIVNKNDFNGFELGLVLLDAINNLYPNKFMFLGENDYYFFDRLLGTDKVRKSLINWQKNQVKINEFIKKVKKYLIY